MPQAVSSCISLNAIRPAQLISLGALEPFHDMAIFGLYEVNKFKIPFPLVGGYSLLDGIMGRGWDVKPLHANVADCHFKFVTSLTVYLDRKHFTLSFHFLIPRLHFHGAQIAGRSARHFLNSVKFYLKYFFDLKFCC